MMLRLLPLVLLGLLPACQRAERVDACTLLANPAPYEGRRVELAGSVWPEPDGRPYFRACGLPDARRIALVWRAGVDWTPPAGGAAPHMLVTAIVERDGNGWRLDGIGYEGAGFFH